MNLDFALKIFTNTSKHITVPQHSPKKVLLANFVLSFFFFFFLVHDQIFPPQVFESIWLINTGR